MTAPRRTVLIVDDEAAIRLLCRVNLELDGHRVLEAQSIDEARGLLASEQVGLVLLDVHVGTGDGFELLSELRRDQPGVPVAMLTGTAEVETVRRHRPDAIIGKPFALEELRGTVENLQRASSEG